MITPASVKRYLEKQNTLWMYHPWLVMVRLLIESMQTVFTFWSTWMATPRVHAMRYLLWDLHQYRYGSIINFFSLPLFVQIICGSRKYAYPTMKQIRKRTPPHPHWNFQFVFSSTSLLLGMFLNFIRGWDIFWIHTIPAAWKRGAPSSSNQMIIAYLWQKSRL